MMHVNPELSKWLGEIAQVILDIIDAKLELATTHDEEMKGFLRNVETENTKELFRLLKGDTQ